MLKKLSRFVMKMAEIFLLRTHGWTSATEFDGQRWWFPPDNYIWTRKRNKPHRRGHAINSLKQALYNRYEERPRSHFEEDEEEETS